MLMSSVTHVSELFVFGWGSPVMAVVLGFGAAFFLIGRALLRDGDRVLLWGATLPALAVILGVGNSIRSGELHPYTIWHILVDLTVFPICAYLRADRRARESLEALVEDGRGAAIPSRRNHGR
jgi:predicted lysophospholipase L1 biosynthesis ABC-type transport system permease subunit